MTRTCQLCLGPLTVKYYQNRLSFFSVERFPDTARHLLVLHDSLFLRHRLQLDLFRVNLIMRELDPDLSIIEPTPDHPFQWSESHRLSSKGLHLSFKFCLRLPVSTGRRFSDTTITKNRHIQWPQAGFLKSKCDIVSLHCSYVSFQNRFPHL